jgi:pimeloyl-ACP methyl ester carboxylesterase
MVTIMPSTHANGLEIEYDTLGDASLPAVLLIMGLGAQMIAWDPGFCQAIADCGYYVIRFDNRDVGLSTWLDDAGAPSLSDIVTGDVVPAYSLADMAADAAGLLDALAIASAHIVGASMGGMIAQTFAIDHPTKALTLTSIMSTTGNPAVGQPTPDALAALLAPAPVSREEAIEGGVFFSKVVGSPGFPFDEPRIREEIAADYDRSFHPAGVQRQGAALVTQPDRTQALGSLRVPTLVIHGADDPLVVLSGGHATADAVPGAELRVVPGMGHDLPLALHTEFVDSLTTHFARASNLASHVRHRVAPTEEVLEVADRNVKMRPEAVSVEFSIHAG